MKPEVGHGAVADFIYLPTGEGWLYVAGGRRSVFSPRRRLVDAGDDDDTTGDGCVGDGDLTERDAQRRVASLGSRQPVHQ